MCRPASNGAGPHRDTRSAPNTRPTAHATPRSEWLQTAPYDLRVTFLLNRAEQQVLQLDQRLHLIQSARDEDLIHEMFGLLDLTTSEYTLTSALGDLGRQYTQMTQRYAETERQLLVEAFGLLDQLYAIEPTFVKPNLDQSVPFSPLHEFTLRAVEEIRAGKRSMPWNQSLDDEDDHTDGSVVFTGILSELKGNTVLWPLVETEVEPATGLYLALRQASEQRSTAFKLMISQRRIHPFQAFLLLLSFYRIAFPQRKRAQTWAEYSRQQITSTHHDWSRVDAALGGDVSLEFAALLKKNAERLIYGLQNRLRSTASMLELIHRFRARAMWYDKTRLRELAMTLAQGKKVNPVEDKLTRELALYLFDNGLPVLLRADIENVQLDALGINTPVLVEAKAYKDSKQKAAVIAGISQLHAYMTNLEASKLHVEDAFYVVFRLGGPLYDLPTVIETNRFKIYPVMVDIAESKVSGRKQPKPVMITREEIMSQNM